jgi:hypothetical protein
MWATGLSLITPFPKRPQWPLKGHLFLNAGRLASVDPGASLPYPSIDDLLISFHSSTSHWKPQEPDFSALHHSGCRTHVPSLARADRGELGSPTDDDRRRRRSQGTSVWSRDELPVIVGHSPEWNLDLRHPSAPSSARSSSVLLPTCEQQLTFLVVLLHLPASTPCLAHASPSPPH